MEEVNAAAASSPAERLLEAADRVFYAEGIHGVPVDQVMAEARVARATFYRHFSGKEDLVVAYLRRRDQLIRAEAERVAASGAGPREMAAALVQGIVDDVCRPGFRGCPFINAAAEYHDPRHPVRAVVTEHRQWFHSLLVGLAAALGHPDPSATADRVVMLRDGAMVAGYLDDPDVVNARLAAAVAEILG